MTTATRKRRLSLEERQARERESLARIQASPSWANYGDVIRGFTAMGIPADSILPKENVFTYNAWRALGRQVKKGEHGVKISVWISTTRKERDPSNGEEKETGGRYCTHSTVFHVSQTSEIGAQQ